MRNVRRKPRLKLAFALAAVAIAVPVVSSCGVQGFDYATDRPNVIANGGYHTEGNIHVLAARIIAPADGTGTFVATIATEPGTGPVSLESLTSSGGLEPGFFKSIEVTTVNAVNLYTRGGIPVTGDFKAGEIVPVTLGFSEGDKTTKITLSAIVVTQCHEYADPEVQIPQNVVSSDDAYSCTYPTLPAATE